MQTDSPKPARRSRTKLRKPKYLSLRLELSPHTSDTTASAAVAKIQRDRRDRRKQKTRSQLKLPPLAPEIDPEDDENVVAADFLFNGDDTSATTLSSLLDSAATEMASSPVDSVGSVMEGGCAPSSLFLRAAMKSSCRRGTDQGEETVEKWVSYSKVVDRKPHDDELSSCGAANDNAGGRQRRQQRVVEKKLCLKLDYEEVLNSWSDKGSLFIQGGGDFFCHQQYQEQPPQTVPDLSAESLAPDSAINGHIDDGLENAVNMWAVPDVPKDDLTLEDNHQSWFRQREASVLRYKEKRQNRLFAKRIRYQVRKLNAEKRPRVKGRFVRRGPEDDEDQKEDKIL